MLEIACFNTESAIAAANAGADRIELCADYAAGGVTPSLAALQQLRQKASLPVNVMIRPRAGNFVYSDTEYEEMITQIETFKTEASGFVFGILDSDDRVDIGRNQKLVELAKPLPCTFHRAFDQIGDMNEATEQLIACGFRSILTSGGQSNAVAGAAQVAKLHRQWGAQISFILGGGVRSTNVGGLKDETSVEWYHSAAITQGGEDVDEDEVAKLQSALSQR
ncbi:hypothetical protein BU24DRAFT_435548 [Aaosphaeria arxii CBS 175.79]|uniref:Copper homeostasis protein cutC homolog n=1 Tax=Aaosphaeria arxii CBS 175.79 TaxID=1450172 RepID=A0A6A5XH59_9PLEO|nr:uncharacterized protein BU24DRAFT_435548 [Aaosphaeria arxii CBS 175.79]KAF2012131.1 hypothetical protein BU24DRAFT_435548 [Aaosphaeria arxii CBS 175.79]